MGPRIANHFEYAGLVVTGYLPLFLVVLTALPGPPIEAASWLARASVLGSFLAMGALLFLRWRQRPRSQQLRGLLLSQAGLQYPWIAAIVVWLSGSGEVFATALSIGWFAPLLIPLGFTRMLGRGEEGVPGIVWGMVQVAWFWVFLVWMISSSF